MHIIHLQIAESVHQIKFGFEYFSGNHFHASDFINTEIDNFSEKASVEEVAKLIQQYEKNLFICRVSESKSMGSLSRIFNLILDAEEDKLDQMYCIIIGKNKHIDKLTQAIPSFNFVHLMNSKDINEALLKLKL